MIFTVFRLSRLSRLVPSRLRRLLLGLLLFAVASFLLLSTGSLNVHNDGFDIFTMLMIRSKNAWLNRDMTKCSPIKNIAYLKVHKAASSSIQALLFRFGLKHGLNFALPVGRMDNYFSKTVPFHARMIPASFVRDVGINIFAIHTKWSFEQITSVMPKDTIYLASVREPVEVFESLFQYAEFEKVSNMTIDEYVRHTPVDANRIDSYLGYNQMIWDFGLAEEVLFNQQAAKSLIDEADEKFDLVLLADRLDQSLILMRYLLCWSYEDIVSFKINARQQQFKTKLKSETVHLLEEILSSDRLLYDRMKVKLDQLIHEFGKARMKAELTKLERARKRVRAKCNLTQAKSELLREGFNQPYSEMVTGYTGNVQDESCKLFMYSELHFIEYIKRKQRLKIQKERKNTGQFTDILDSLPFGAIPLTSQNMTHVRRKYRKLGHHYTHT